jgi:hypothetical protein
LDHQQGGAETVGLFDIEQPRAMAPVLAKLLDDGIARGEGHLDVAAGVRVPAA